MAGKCSDKTFQMICNGRGFWHGFQKCVKKMCVVNETLYSKFVPVGSTHSPSCPRGLRLADNEFFFKKRQLSNELCEDVPGVGM